MESSNQQNEPVERTSGKAQNIKYDDALEGSYSSKGSIHNKSASGSHDGGAASTKPFFLLDPGSNMGFTESPARPSPSRLVSLLSRISQVYPRQTHFEVLEKDSGNNQSTKGSTPALETSEFRECAACNEQKQRGEVAVALCGHCYCGTCVEKLIQRALDDFQYLPCRCCREPIPFRAMQLVSPGPLVNLYAARLEEQQRASRTTCSERTTPTPLDRISGPRARCPRCMRITCVICKDAAHALDLCPADTGDSEVLAAANEMEWQRCSACGYVVEKIYGCNHMK